MKNPAPYLRETLYALLNNNVTYQAAIVPVKENESDNYERRILIADYNDTSKGTKDNFGADATQVIEVIAEQNTAKREHVDAIGELVMNILKPTTKSDLLSGADFQIFIKGKPSLNHITEHDGPVKKIVRLIMRYQLTIIEK